MIDSQSASHGGYHPAGTSGIYVAWHSDPQCPRAAGKDLYDPHNRPQGIVYGYQPEGRAVRPLGQPRWTALDVADALVSGEQPPSCLCPQCITGLDVDRLAIPDDRLPDDEDDMSATRRLDGKPETPADTRFSGLRERSYTGPIDQGGTGHGTPDDPHHPGRRPTRATTSPGGTTPAMTRLTIGLPTPVTDTEFLESCTQLGDVPGRLADQLATWADGLYALNLPACGAGPAAPG